MVYLEIHIYILPWLLSPTAAAVKMIKFFLAYSLEINTKAIAIQDRRAHVE